jgi:hypothetical protein
LIQCIHQRVNYQQTVFHSYEEVKSEARWKLKTKERVQGEDGKWEDREKEERIPLPENYRLGLEGRGMELNNSSRYGNVFGKNCRPLFPSK